MPPPLHHIRSHPAPGLGVAHPSRALQRGDPGDGAPSSRSPNNLLAADVRVLFPIIRSAARGLAQPGFNKVALRVRHPLSETRDLAETLVLSQNIHFNKISCLEGCT